MATLDEANQNKGNVNMSVFAKPINKNYILKQNKMEDFKNHVNSISIEEIQTQVHKLSLQNKKGKRIFFDDTKIRK